MKTNITVFVKSETDKMLENEIQSRSDIDRMKVQFFSPIGPA